MKIRRLEKNIIILNNLSDTHRRTNVHGYIVNIQNKYKNLINNLNVSLKNKFLKRDIRRMVKTRNLINIIDAVLKEIDNEDVEIVLNNIRIDVLDLEIDIS